MIRTGVGLLVLAVVSCVSPDTRSPAQTSVFASGLGDPAGIATTPSGLVLVADAGKGHVVVFDGKGRRLRTFGSGILESPLGLAVDADGSVLVSDSVYPERPWNASQKWMTCVPISFFAPRAKFFLTFQSNAALSAFSTARAPPSIRKRRGR